MWHLSDADMLLLWRDVERRQGRRASDRIEAMLVALTGRGGTMSAPGQHIADFVLPGLPTRPWYEPGEFEWVAALEDRASELRRVYREVRALREARAAGDPVPFEQPAEPDREAA